MLHDFHDLKKHRESMIGRTVSDVECFRDVFKHGECHVAEIERIDLLKNKTSNDIACMIFNSIRAMLADGFIADADVKRILVPMYEAAKKYADTYGSDLAVVRELEGLLRESLGFYTAGVASPTLLDGLRWHEMAHYRLGMALSYDHAEVEGIYTAIFAEWLAEKNTP